MRMPEIAEAIKILSPYGSASLTETIESAGRS